MTSSPRGKTIAITGAASGIGLATAKLLARQGARLSLADIQGDQLRRVAEELRSSSSNSGEEGAVDNVLTTVVDVRDRSQVEDWMSRTIAHFGGGPLDGAANLAGTEGGSVGAAGLAVRDLTDDEFDHVMDVNCKGTLNCVRAQLRHAVIAITRCAAKEEGAKGVRVNAVAPGFIATPMLDRITQALGGHPMPEPAAMARRGSADEAAQLICFLLAEESSFVTGAVYTVDGGWYC